MEIMLLNQDFNLDEISVVKSRF